MFEDPDDTTACTSSSNYLYDSFEYDSTIVTELDLVCDEDFKVRRSTAYRLIQPFSSKGSCAYFQVALISSIYMSGLILGSIISGTMDRFGRKNILMLSILLAGCGGLGTAFTSSYGAFCALRFMTSSGYN